MEERFIRTEMLIGEEGLNQLKQAKVAIYGVGGVGTYVAEGLVRAGIGRFLLVDDDVISESNCNRQLHATTQTIGKSKVKTMKERMESINPDVQIDIMESFVLYDNIEDVVPNDLSYMVDALDTVTAKIALALKSKEYTIPLISAMGTGNKFEPTKLQVSDLFKTNVCPLCKVMRKELKARGIKKLKVVYSEEQPTKPLFDPSDFDGKEENGEEQKNLHKKRSTPGSMSFVPSVAGMIIASEVVKDLLGR
ncbi:tRNA threonylcarbamoyladenosine dehydratase [Anaerosporobacter faecicola]|uniref:tRNA threonylcarbamoyladenosine dehydratase n=1 Tax=Anaerosporobacter faecicola TaxID=2718714 RepID=UPI00143B23BE|nr:tRNA threonylcarbamoyladenosine dehydratase [Anaerosporobacter faecicola]